MAYSGIAHSAKQVEREEKRIGIGREETIASEAIGLFLEYRDKRGETEEQAPGMRDF